MFLDASGVDTTGEGGRSLKYLRADVRQRGRKPFQCRVAGELASTEPLADSACTWTSGALVGARIAVSKPVDA